jgi:hypothetical protein
MKYYNIIFILILFSSCANVGTLGGGPIDEEPPVLLKSNLSRDNFANRSIILEFDEYVNLANAEQNILIIPKTCNLKISSINKKVVIQLDSQLKNDITYNLIINGGIVDNNASNKFFYNFIFSANKLTDTSLIHIDISNIESNKNLKVCINTNNGMDSFKNFNTAYMMSVENEKVIYKGLSNDSANLWLYTDKNNDNKPDLYEPINFIKNIKKDSSYDLSIVNWKKPFKINKVINDESFQFIKVYYDKEENLSRVVSQIKIDSMDLIIITPEYAIAKKSIKTSNFLIDTSIKFNLKNDLKNYTFNSIKIVKNRNNYTVGYKLPYDYKNYQKNNHLNVHRRTLNIKPDTFIITDKNLSIQDTFNLKNINIIEEQKFSHLELSIESGTDNSFDIIITKNGKYFMTIFDANLIDEYFDPNVYKIEIYKHNYENIFNPIYMIKNMKPIYEKTLYLKASWEEKLDVKVE